MSLAILPTELLDLITGEEYKTAARLVRTCKKYYEWGGRKALTHNQEYLSAYVQKLLDSFSLSDIERSLSRFQDGVCKTPIHLRLQYCYIPAWHSRKLCVIAKKFPNLSELFYTTAQTTLPIPILQRRHPLPFTFRSVCDFVDRYKYRLPNALIQCISKLNRLPVLFKKVTEQDLYLKNIVKIFPRIHTLHVDCKNLPGSYLCLPEMPSLKELTVSAPYNYVATCDKDLFTKFPSLSALHLDASFIRPSSIHGEEHLETPRQLESLTLGPDYTVTKERLEEIFTHSQALQSLEIARPSIELDTFEIRAVASELHTLSIRVPHLGYQRMLTPFPNLRSLHLVVQMRLGAIIFPRSRTVERLHIEIEKISQGEVRAFLAGFPNLKFFQLDYSHGPRRITPLATHPNLELVLNH